MIKWLIVVTFVSVTNPNNDASIELASNWWGGGSTLDVVAPHFKTLEECEGRLLKEAQANSGYKFNKVMRPEMRLMDHTGAITQGRSLALYYVRNTKDADGKEKSQMHIQQCVPIVYR